MFDPAAPRTRNIPTKAYSGRGHVQVKSIVATDLVQPMRTTQGYSYSRPFDTVTQNCRHCCNRTIPQHIPTQLFVDFDTMFPVNGHDIGIGQCSLFPLRYIAPTLLFPAPARRQATNW
jgi:hypothetical protein